MMITAEFLKPREHNGRMRDRGELVRMTEAAYRRFAAEGVCRRSVFFPNRNKAILMPGRCK